MRTPLDSPFSPGSDIVPQVWAGRTAQLSDWRDVLRPRRLSGVYERGRTILGEAGLGKSSLVRRIALEAEAAGDWVTPQLRIPVNADPLKKVAEALLAVADTAGLTTAKDRRIGELLGRVEAVAAAGFSVSLRGGAPGPEPYTVLTDLLIELGLAAGRRKNTMVLVHIDEIQNITDEAVLSQLLIALGDALSHEFTVVAPGGVHLSRVLPLAVYLTGLPEFADLAGARKGATFARRFHTTVLQPVDDGDLTAALQPFVVEGWPVAGRGGGMDRVSMEQEAQQAIVALSCGEPYLFQLAGQAAWFAGTGQIITRDDVLAGWESAESEAEQHVQRILDRLPTKEREFLWAMVEVEPEERTLTTIASAAGFAKATDAGPTSQRLDLTRRIIARGRKYRFRHRAVEAFLTTAWPEVEYLDEVGGEDG